jgi:hypothetical protein
VVPATFVPPVPPGPWVKEHVPLAFVVHEKSGTSGVFVPSGSSGPVASTSTTVPVVTAPSWFVTVHVTVWAVPVGFVSVSGAQSSRDGAFGFCHTFWTTSTSSFAGAGASGPAASSASARPSPPQVPFVLLFAIAGAAFVHTQIRSVPGVLLCVYVTEHDDAFTVVHERSGLPVVFPLSFAASLGDPEKNSKRTVVFPWKGSPNWS